MKKCLPIICFIALISGFGLNAESPPIGILNTMGARYNADIDWQRMELHIRISAPVDNDPAVRNRATLISRKESELKDFFPTIFPLCLHGIRLDTLHLLKDLMVSNTELTLALESLADQVELQSVQPATDLKSVTIEYRLSIAKALNPLLVGHGTPNELPKLLDWQAAADYTGLIVYVQNDLNWYGNDLPANFTPSLFPRLFDEDGRLILDISRMDPGTAAQQGPFTYVDSIKNALTTLAGKKPLVVSARAVYGETPCDLMISRTDANTLLYNQQTRQALQQGKIVVVLSPSSLKQQIVR